MSLVNELQNSDATLIDYLETHIGVLAVEYVPIDDASGEETAIPQMQTCSGFFIKLEKVWYFVTAGHVFERSDDGKLGLFQALDRKQIRVKQAFIADYFGKEAQWRDWPTVISFDDIRDGAIVVNDEKLDFAFLPLRGFYVESLKKNGVLPLTEDQWQHKCEAMKYIVIGFPDEEKSPSPSVTSTDASIRLCFARMDRCELPNHLPKPAAPYIAAKLPDEGPHSPVGFSGSPIFAVDIDVENDRTLYSLVAIDYKWHPNERIIVGCLMTDAVAAFRSSK